MKNFLIVWIGQTVSMIGSSMTSFAITIWVWQVTGQATALALFGFFTQVPQVLMALIAGVIVDRTQRKLLIMLGDTVSGLVTIAILLVYLTHHLQLWHLYLAVAVKGTFEQFQQLAYSAAISTMIPKQHYGRASSMGFLASYGAQIMAPALAGMVYATIGLVGILIIDLTTFAIAIITVLRVHIPQPTITVADTQSPTNIQQEMSFGWRYITARPSLLAILVITSLFWLAHDIGSSLYAPMILARTGNNAQLLGLLASAAGIGGVIGALVTSRWGGFQRRIDGMLLGMVGAGLSKTIFGLAGMPLIWIPAQFCSSLNFPLLGSSIDAIWLSKVKPNIQGRVFATRSMILLITSAFATLIAGPLADYVFEPMMMPGGSLTPIMGKLFGTQKGAGITLLYAVSSLSLLVVGFSGYACRTLRNLDTILPDHDADTA
ncbi:MFS transporter [Cylindrospermum sp. FACHB-282]|uniref:MFS transporter n=1 Tax=Cylindrospermum sp. FACHB-282 TaxID=2692794 RepID=UPI001689A2E5|nr:MFS transporter [Cylindrospermum sp. FACHB-282]MBD2385745.1 MFS transporter [Cylindrospermum sp. FACHB-282]